MSDLDVALSDASTYADSSYYMDPNFGYYYDQTGYYSNCGTYPGYDYSQDYAACYNDENYYATLPAPAEPTLTSLTSRESCDAVTYELQDVTILRQESDQDVAKSSDVTSEQGSSKHHGGDVMDDNMTDDDGNSSSDSDASSSSSDQSGVANRENKQPRHHKAPLGLRRKACKRRQRRAANIRERERMKTINNAFELLRVRVPSACDDRKLSKVDTLKMAIKYIGDLTCLLKSCGDGALPGLRSKTNNRIRLLYSPGRQCYFHLCCVISWLK